MVVTFGKTISYVKYIVACSYFRRLVTSSVFILNEEVIVELIYILRVSMLMGTTLKCCKAHAKNRMQVSDLVFAKPLERELIRDPTY